MNKSFRKILILFTLFSFLIPSLTMAATVNYNNLISDEEAENYNSMSQMDIKNFLTDKGSYLRSYFYNGSNPGPSDEPIDREAKYFKSRSATEIIYNASQEFKINPEFLLTMLQKEMGLIEEANPTENQLAYAMGYDCPDGGGCAFRTKGFGKQVRATAEQFRWYVDNIHQYIYRPGVTVCIDDPLPSLPCTSKGTAVTPENKITAAMYIYTPHIHGNSLFVTLWDKYAFGGAMTGGVLTGILPDGSLVKAKDGDDTGSVYLIDGNTKRAFNSMTALVSRFDPKLILEVSSDEINKYSDGALIKYPNYSVLQGPNGNKYLLDNLEKRLISSDEAFRQLGFNPEEVIEVTADDLSSFSNGSTLTESDLSPFEHLLMDMSTGGVYYVKGNQKAPIIDPSILKINYPDLKVTEVTSKTLEQYQKIGAVKLKDGNLIKIENNSNVYAMSNGLRRLIADEETFNALGYSWDSIHEVNAKVLYLHGIGDLLSL